MNLYLRFYTYDLINLSYLDGAYSNDERFIYHADKIPDQIIELAECDEIENIYIELIDEPEFRGNKYVREFVEVVCSSSKVKINVSGHTYNPTHLTILEQNHLDFKTINIQKPMLCFTPWSHFIFTPNWIVNENSSMLDENFYVALELDDDSSMRMRVSKNVKESEKLRDVITKSYTNWRNDNEEDMVPNANTKFVYGQQISYWLYRFREDLFEIKMAYDEAIKTKNYSQNYISQENKDEGKKDFGSWL